MVNALFLRIIIFQCVCFLFVLESLAQPTFKYGNNNANYPSLIKNDGNNVYILGQEDKNGTSYGTITKLDANSGNIIWQKELDFPSQINDMEFIPPQGPLGKTSLYIVGHTLPFDINNASFLVQINGETNAIECSNIFNQTGRESFRKIIRHPNPSNPNFPYYILGSKGIQGGSVTQNKVFLVNIRSFCSGGTNVNFVREFSFFANPLDMEFFRGLSTLSDGSILLMGNETTNGLGMAVKLNGAGNFVSGVVYNGDMEVMDAVELPNSNIVFSGTRFINNIQSGVLFVTDSKLAVLGTAYENKNTLSYNDIVSETPGSYYLHSLYKPVQNSNSTTFPVVQKLMIGGSAALPNLSFLWQKSLENGNTSNIYKGLSLTANFNGDLFYTDGRGLNNTNPDFTYAKSNSSFQLPCTDSLTTSLSSFELGYNNIEITLSPITLPAPTQGNYRNTDWAKSDFCAAPCALDFTISTTERECNNVLCNINIINGSLPYTLSWDFNCDGTVDATGIPAQYTFTSSGSHQICIKVMDGKECVKEKSFTIITNGDGEAPVLTCPDNITIQCNGITDPSNTGIPTVTDNADSNPTLISLDDLVTENTPCLKKIVRTWKAIDDCNNESTCTQVITIKDEISPVFISCGRKIEVQGIRDANGKCKEKVTLLAPAVTDQCDSNPSVVNSYTNTNNATADYNEGTTIVTWTATDQCGNVSVCRDTVVVNCDPCCINKQDFIDRVENAVTTTLNTQDCEVFLTVSGLLSCDELKSINWGDGNTENGPFVFPLTHTYSVNGNYIISCLFQENNSNGNGCFEQNVTLPINIECCECNTADNAIIVQNEKICFIDETPDFFKISDNHSLTGRDQHSAIWTGTEMIIWGGRTSISGGGSNFHQNGAKYDPASDTWQPTSSINAPSPRSGHSAIWTGSDMIIWGGLNNTNPSGFTNTGGIYNPISNTWQPISTVNAPLPRHYHVAFWTGSEMIIWGGFSSSGFENGGIYNPATNSWRLIQSPSINFTLLDLAVWTGQELVVFSGQDKILHYNLVNDSWTQFPRPWYHLTFSSIVYQGSHIYYYSNIEFSSSPGNPVGYKYNILTHDIINFDLTNAPDIDQEPKAYFTGKHIMYFDWVTNDEPNIIGYLYNIENNKFENFSFSIPAESKAWGSIIYANNQFIQWGGRKTLPNINLPGSFYNDGYIIKNIYKSLSDTITCDPNEITNLPCPLSDSSHSFTINVACDNGCESENITWHIKDPNNNTIKSGTNTNGFVVTLSQGEVTTNGEYILEMEYYCGIDNCSCVSKMNFEDCLTSAQDIELDNQIKIYPNPTSGQFTMDFKNGNVAFDNALIYDLQGRWIKTIALAKGMAKQEIDLVQNENGMYLVRLIDKEGTSLIRKIVKVN